MRVWLAWVLGALVSGGCSAPPKPPTGDLTGQRLAEQGNGAFADGRIDEAMRSYARALERGRLMDDAQAIGDAAYNLGVCLLDQGNTGEATLLFDEALYELDRAGDSLADPLLMRAKVAALSGDGALALTLAKDVESNPRSMPQARHLAEVEVLRGQSMAAASDWPGASQHLSRAKALASKSQDPWIHSSILGLEAQILRGADDLVGAAQVLDRQTDALRLDGRFTQMAQSLKAAGHAWLEAGDPCQACDRWVRAARSVASAHNNAAALSICETALRVAEKCPDTETVQRVLGLAARLRPDSTSE